tara:strand:- start:262 stop:474 length:213 start_codon:yes stop_codon:yes gene_type:complete
MLGICTKLKYHNNPIHIIATTTWIYLNNQLQKRMSKSKPPLPKYNPKNRIIDNAIDKCTVFESDCRIEIM